MNKTEDLYRQANDACEYILDWFVNSGLFNSLGDEFADLLNRKSKEDEDIIEVYEVKKELSEGEKDGAFEN